MIRGVGPYSTLITPQAGSLFHAAFHPGGLPKLDCRPGVGRIEAMQPAGLSAGRFSTVRIENIWLYNS